MKLRIALFSRPGDEHKMIWGEASLSWLAESHVRRSEWVEVEFPDISREETVAAELAILDTMEAAVRVDLQRKIDAIAEQRAKLLSIGFDRHPHGGDAAAGETQQ